MHDNTPARSRIFARSAKRRECYEVKGGKLFKTINGAAKNEAWAMILNRYCNVIGKLSDISEFRGMQCDCYDDTGGRDSLDCPIHSRHDGYFARLHRRLWPQIVAKWEAANRAEAQE